MRVLLRLSAGLLSAIMACPGLAAPIPLDGGWQYFAFGDVGSSFGQTFDFTLADSAEFKITDVNYDGDQFQIYINAVSQGLTSAPANDGTYFTDPNLAFASPLFSHGSYILGPGSYSISGTVVASPYGSGHAFAELVSYQMPDPDPTPAAVPEPATWAMMLVGFGAIGFTLRRKIGRTTIRQVA